MSCVGHLDRAATQLTVKTAAQMTNRADTQMTNRAATQMTNRAETQMTNRPDTLLIPVDNLLVKERTTLLGKVSEAQLSVGLLLITP